MPNFNAIFKAEVARLARKEIRAELGPTKKTAAQLRHDVAALKRQVTALEKKVAAKPAPPRKTGKAAPRKKAAKRASGGPAKKKARKKAKKGKK